MPSSSCALMTLTCGSSQPRTEGRTSRNPTFREIAESWRQYEMRKLGAIGRKAAETIVRDEHNLDVYALPRWGDDVATHVKPTEVERWFEFLASGSTGTVGRALKWPTIGKIKSVMSQVYAHAQRYELIPAEMHCNPFRAARFGGARCRTESNYQAVVVSPKQMIAILNKLDTPDTRLEWTLALVHAATALRPEECFALKWSDIDCVNNRILVRRAWSKGKETTGKNRSSMRPVVMHPVLAQYLTRWRRESLYGEDSNWVFPSYREKGRIPRAASKCGRAYLRPAAIAAGVIDRGHSIRFGWHNLRHSLATFFGANNVHPSVIQRMLRHSSPTMTAKYIHEVNAEQLEAQGMFLHALKLRKHR
jgi:integrase